MNEPEGSGHLSVASKLGAKLLTSTAPAGHPRIQSEIQSITADFEDYNSQVRFTLVWPVNIGTWYLVY